MKLKIIIFLVVMLIAQTHIAHGSSFLSLNLAGPVVSNIQSTNDPLLNSVLISVVQALEKDAIHTTRLINSALAAKGQLVSNVAKRIASTAGDAISTVNIALTSTAVNVGSIIANAVNPITEFCNTVCKLIANNTVLLSNPIDNTSQFIVSLSSTLDLADILNPTTNLISQGVAKSSDALQTIGTTLQNVVDEVFTTIPNALRSGLNALTITSSNIDNVLTIASKITNVLAAQVAVGTQSLSLSVFPVTTTLIDLINNLTNAIKSVTNMIKNNIMEIQNSADAIVTLCNDQHREIIASLVAVKTACANTALIASDNLATNTIPKAGSCVTNEISMLENYLAQYLDLVAQYQTGMASNTISISDLQQVVQTSIALKLYVLSVKFRVEGCIAATFLNAAGNFVSIADSAVKCIV